jgi:hypothetical protein
MRKALSTVLAVAVAVIAMPITTVTAQKIAGSPSAQAVKTGNISGKVTDVKPGQNVTVQLRDARGQLVGNPVTPGPTGEFTFSGLNPGTYTIQVVQGTQVLPMTLTVAAGQTATVTVSAAVLSAALAAAAAGGILRMSTTLAVTTLTVAGAVIGRFVANKPVASGSR